MSLAWNNFLKAAERLGSCAVTRRALSLGAQDSTTGWYAKSFAETSIKMFIVSRAASSTHLPPGVYVRTEYLGLTRDTVALGDEIKDADNDYYEIKTIRKHKIGATLYFYECDLTLLHLHS